MLTKDTIGLKWTRAGHPAGFSVDYCDISPQKARALMNKDGQQDKHLPSCGCMRLLGCDMWLVNRGGQYSIQCQD